MCCCGARCDRFVTRLSERRQDASWIVFFDKSIRLILDIVNSWCIRFEDLSGLAHESSPERVSSEVDNAAEVTPGMHVREALVDLIEGVAVGDQAVEVELSARV